MLGTRLQSILARVYMLCMHASRARAPCARGVVRFGIVVAERMMLLGTALLFLVDDHPSSTCLAYARVQSRRNLGNRPQDLTSWHLRTLNFSRQWRIAGSLGRTRCLAELRPLPCRVAYTIHAQAALISISPCTSRWL